MKKNKENESTRYMCTCKTVRYPSNFFVSSKLASSCSYKWANAATPQAYSPHDCESLKSTKQDTWIKVGLLSIKQIHPTRCNKHARVVHSHCCFSQQFLYTSLNQLNLIQGSQHCLISTVALVWFMPKRSMIQHRTSSKSKASFKHNRPIVYLFMSSLTRANIKPLLA